MTLIQHVRLEDGEAISGVILFVMGFAWKPVGILSRVAVSAFE
jgi:hypothetical protein